MEQILKTISEIEGQLEEVKAEAEQANEKGTFSYARSKTIRKGALEIGKLAKDLRGITLDTFKAQKGE